MIYKMESKQVHLLLCVVYCFSLTMSMESSILFVNIDSIEGPILLETERDSVEDCVALCAQHTPTCGGTAYDVVTEKCILQDKWAVEETKPVYIFHKNPQRTIFKKVGVGCLARRHLTSLRSFMYL